MLWTVCHLWLSRSRFVSNCYCHWLLLVLKNSNGIASFLHIREFVTQGDPLSIIEYGIGFLLLIKCPKTAYPYVTQHWHTEYYMALGMFNNIGSYLNMLKLFGPGCEY